MSIFIPHPDSAFMSGNKYANTGETAEEYTKRLSNQSKYFFDSNIKEHVYDQDFVTKLPYTMTGPGVDEVIDPNESIFDRAKRLAKLHLDLTTYDIFKQNVEASLKGVPEDIVNTEVKEFTDAFLSRKLHQVEINTTEMGGNDALNCYWSFNENDDIVYPNYALDPKECTLGLGRVYYETYQSKQVIIWMTFGVPEYVGIADFYNEAMNPKLAAEMHTGTTPFVGLLGRIIGGALSFTFKLATLPLYVLHQLGRIMSAYRITKYYELRATMPLYFRAVNNLMGVVSVNLGLQKGESEYDKGVDEANYVPFDRNNLPGVIKNGISIYQVLAKRAIYFAKQEGRNPPKNDEEILELFEKSQGIPEYFAEQGEYSSGTGNHLLQNISDSFMAAVTCSNAYVGFRIEKSVDASESISNSTAPSELQQALNSAMQKKASLSFTTQGGKIDSSVFGKIAQGFIDVVKGVIQGFSFNAAGLLTDVGYFDIPEVWKESSFHTNYSFSTKLVSHYCDRVSIFQNCYIPLFCLLAAALPRQVGKNTYVEPFLCRVYCQGRFAIALGIIDSMTIKRGKDEFGWTEEGLPTQIDVTWTVKDLSPLMFMGLSGANGGSGIISDLLSIFESNNTMQEYLSTLGAIGLRERVVYSKVIKRKFRAWWNVNFATKLLNPYFWGSTMGSIPMLQSALAWKFSRLSNH